MTEENSLTCPEDRDHKKGWRPSKKPPLAESELNEAMNVLNDISFVEKFSRVDRAFCDPALPMQNISLFSFTPAKGATPNESGVFGFGKVRGTFNLPQEAEERAEFIIRNVDSTHQVFHTYTGRPFPITNSSKYSAETSEIDIRKEMTKATSNNVKERRQTDEQTVREIKDREEQLITESKQDPENADPYDEYITLKVKKAQLSWTYLEHKKKMAEILPIIVKTRDRLAELDIQDPEFQEKYYEKYMKARKEAGLSDDASKENFIQFLVDDVELE
tara:strand:+ start:232 stop:1056 length:825 start_codon:yes stop_codon:yes gene_type:complete